MKLHTFFFIIILLSLMSCSKSSDNENETSDYFIRFKYEGQEVEIKNTIGLSDAVLYYDASGQLFSVSIIGNNNLNSSQGLKDAITILVYDTVMIRSNFEYNIHHPVNRINVPIPRIAFTYTDKEGITYNAVIRRTDLVNTLNEAKFKITEQTDEYIRGTFSATLIHPTNQTQTKSITDGEFYLKLNMTQLL